MRQFKNLKPFIHRVNSIRFPKNNKKPYLIVYFSENSTFIEDYPKLDLKRIDFRLVTIPSTRIPRTRLIPSIRKMFKAYNLLPIPSGQKVPTGINIIFDLSFFLKAIDETYKPKNYRQRAGFLIKNIIQKAFSEYPNNYQKILLYSIDTTKDINKLIMNRKIFPVIQQIKDNEHHFDNMLVALSGQYKTSYRLLMKDRSINFSRALQLLKNIKTIDINKDEDLNIKQATTTILDKISKNMSTTNNKKYKMAIATFLNSDKETLEKIMLGEIDDDEANEIATTAVLFKLHGNLNKAKQISKSIPKKDKAKGLKVVDKTYMDQLLEPQKTISISDNVYTQSLNIPSMVDNKSPEHLFQKRQLDFKSNLLNDAENSFNVLSNKEISLKVKNIKIEDIKSKASELDKSDEARIVIIMIDKDGKEHKIIINIPKIDKFGTFRVNGQRKVLINQIVVCPISFPKPYDSKFESSYSTFHIESKRRKTGNHLEIYIGSYWMSYLIALSFIYGFEETLKQYKIKYHISDKKPKKDDFGSKINNERFIHFDNVDSELKEEICKSFIKAKVDQYDVDGEFGSQEYFSNLIIAMTGRINSTWLINTIIENIVDPISKQVLINQQLPFKLKQIMHYMAIKTVAGFAQERNDITNQRIRNSEVLIAMLQKQILAAYTEYREQILSGNPNAIFTINQTKLMSDFNNSDIVQSMEYANPVEEMSVMSKVSPIGKSIGGIPDRRAIQIAGRNVHNSYFGNIDPLDTPESDNIGINQQLTVDAFITSQRGLIHKKDLKEGENSGLLSTTTCMIPFIENNDGVRVIMASNQMRQMLPLKNPEPPIVQSGYESILPTVLSDNYIIKSPINGKIKKVQKEDISITNSSGDITHINISPKHLKSGTGKDSLSIFIPKVKNGQTVKKDQVIAEGSSISNGTISLGRTLSIAMMPYKGYNFEDGIIISKSLVDNDKLTSIHGVVEEILISEDDRIIEIIEEDVVTTKGQTLLRKSIGEIEELIGFEEIEDETSEITGGQLIKKSPGGKIVEIEVFSNMDSSKFPKLKPLIDKTRKKYGVAPKEKFTIRKVSIKGILIKFKIEQDLKIGLGDKLCNRFGNKGIISLIEEDNRMPRTPWGEPVEIIVNPLGLISRMNMGQLFELYTGLISKEMANQMIKNSKKEEVISMFKSILPILDTSNNKIFSKRLISNIQGLSTQKFNKLIEQTKNSGFVPLVIPPFKAPSHKDITKAMNVLNLKSGYTLLLPEYNTRTKNLVPLGYMYMSKLEHIGAAKLHGRSIGPMTGKTLQPTQGKSREGGQAMGELDTYSLISYNATTVLNEFFGPLSDDQVTKNEIISEIVQDGQADFRLPKTTPTKDLLNSYFVSLMLEK